MPNYNPMDMAYVLKMSKRGQMTPEEMQLMQNINQAMLPEVAAGNVGIMPATQGRMPVSQQFPMRADQNSVLRQSELDPYSVVRPSEMMRMRGR